MKGGRGGGGGCWEVYSGRIHTITYKAFNNINEMRSLLEDKHARGFGRVSLM